MFYTVGSPKHLSRTPSPSPTHHHQRTRGSRWRAGPACSPRPGLSCVPIHPLRSPDTRSAPRRKGGLVGLRPRVASSLGLLASLPPCCLRFCQRAPHHHRKRNSPILLHPARSLHAHPDPSALIEVWPLESALDSSPVSSSEPAC